VSRKVTVMCGWPCGGPGSAGPPRERGAPGPPRAGVRGPRTPLAQGGWGATTPLGVLCGFGSATADRPGGVAGIWPGERHLPTTSVSQRERGDDLVAGLTSSVPRRGSHVRHIRLTGHVTRQLAPAVVSAMRRFARLTRGPAMIVGLTCRIGRVVYFVGGPGRGVCASWAPAAAFAPHPPGPANAT
jgi:hypothetical protein